jgi:hypothetical protein
MTPKIIKYLLNLFLIQCSFFKCIHYCHKFNFKLIAIFKIVELDEEICFEIKKICGEWVEFLNQIIFQVSIDKKIRNLFFIILIIICARFRDNLMRKEF